MQEKAFDSRSSTQYHGASPSDFASAVPTNIALPGAVLSAEDGVSRLLRDVAHTCAMVKLTTTAGFIKDFIGDNLEKTRRSQRLNRAGLSPTRQVLTSLGRMAFPIHCVEKKGMRVQRRSGNSVVMRGAVVFKREMVTVILLS